MLPLVLCWPAVQNAKELISDLVRSTWKMDGQLEASGWTKMSASLFAF
jgi:hypothetical protein